CKPISGSSRSRARIPAAEPPRWTAEEDAMSSPDLDAQIAAATAYEEFFVPALFREWAARVAGAARIQPGQRVLDVACGTGVLAREAASRVAPNGSVAGLDASPGMLAVAARLA